MPTPPVFHPVTATCPSYSGIITEWLRLTAAGCWLPGDRSESSGEFWRAGTSSVGPVRPICAAANSELLFPADQQSVARRLGHCSRRSPKPAMAAFGSNTVCSTAGPTELRRDYLSSSQPAVHGTAVVGNFLHRVQLPYLLQDPRACVDPGRAAAAAGGRRRRAAGRAPAARAAVRWHREITSRCIWPGPGRAESWPYSPRC
jgi:hypothetical protein